MVALKGKPDIGEGINKIISKLAEENELKGVIDVADFNDSDKLGKGKDMQDRLSNLVAIFQQAALDFSKNRAEGELSVFIMNGSAPPFSAMKIASGASLRHMESGNYCILTDINFRYDPGCSFHSLF
jgi:type I restriction-modification system DNA methylase subunit